LVERFLYTEDVGGSSPSSPTTPFGFYGHMPTIRRGAVSGTGRPLPDDELKIVARKKDMIANSIDYGKDVNLTL
jgi:hypothetical protein